MIFSFKAFDQAGQQKAGTVDAVSREVAIATLQKRGLIVSSVESAEKEPFFGKLKLFDRVKTRDIVILSRQIATLFAAQVSALKVFKLLSSEVEHPALKKSLEEISADVQQGSSLSKSFAKHPDVFSSFYVSMVRSGEESGKLDEVFEFLADYLERSYEVTSKARNALIYPAFVIGVFFIVMVLMFTIVIPKISVILTESGQDLPIYTRAVMGMSGFFVRYGVFILFALIAAVVFMWRYTRSGAGRVALDRFKLSFPFVGRLYRKLYLSRIADNMHTLLASGVSMVRVLEIGSTIVDNEVYKKALAESLEEVKGGAAVSEAFSKHEEIPPIMTQMIKVGEETGELSDIMKTLGRFYTREVTAAVDTLVGLIEPFTIVLLALAVGILLASVLVPIYNISSGIQ